MSHTFEVGRPADLSRRVPLTATFNTRDVSGYPVAEGGRIKEGTILRSDALGSMTDADRAVLRRWGLHTVLDLRDERERSTAPNALEGMDVREQWVPIFENTLFTHDFAAFPDLEQQYEIMLADHGHQVGMAVRAFLEPDALPILVHCTAGKDRTGVVVALVLSAVGVEREWVLEDFAASQVHLGSAFERSVRELYDRAGLPQHILGDAPTLAPLSFLEGALTYIEATYGSIEQFLDVVGVGADLRRDLRELLVV